LFHKTSFHLDIGRYQESVTKNLGLIPRVQEYKKLNFYITGISISNDTKNVIIILNKKTLSSKKFNIFNFF
jgi:hypothetical protein